MGLIVHSDDAFSVVSTQIRLMSPFYARKYEISQCVRLDITGNELSSLEVSELLTQPVGSMKSLFVLFDMTLITHNFTSTAN